jgi:hypothetical protein
MGIRAGWAAHDLAPSAGQPTGTSQRPLLPRVAGLALGTLQHMHLPAERNGRNNKEEYEKPHSGFLNELGQGPTGSAAQHFCCGFRSPEEDLGSDDQHSRASVTMPQPIQKYW